MAKKTRNLTETLESQVAAVLLANRDECVVSNVISTLRPEFFQTPTGRDIFEAVSGLIQNGDNISPDAVVAWLEKNGQLSHFQGAKEVFDIYSHGLLLLVSAPISNYVKNFRELAIKRMAAEEISNRLQDLEESSGQDSISAMSGIQSYLNDIIYEMSETSEFAINLSDSYEVYQKLLQEREEQAKENSLLGIPTLLPTLDKYTTGWKPGMLITLAARTAVGKSVMAINFATAAVYAGRSVLFFSLEMSEEEILDRIFASTTAISMNRLKDPSTLSSDDREILKKVGEEYKQMKLRIETDPNVTVEIIRSKALEYARSNDNGLDMIIVDYLQLVGSTFRTNNRQEEVQKISRSFKLLAKQLQVPIVILSQLNRNKNEEDGMPNMDNIRESGAIAQDSDVVILLHRDKTEDDVIPPTIVNLAKNRGGPADKFIRCHSDLACSVFREMTTGDGNDLETISAEDQMAEFDPNFDPLADNSTEVSANIFEDDDDGEDEFEVDFT